MAWGNIGNCLLCVIYNYLLEKLILLASEFIKKLKTTPNFFRCSF